MQHDGSCDGIFCAGTTFRWVLSMRWDTEAFLQGLRFFCCVDVIGLSGLREGPRVESVSESSLQGQPGLGVMLRVPSLPPRPASRRPHLCCGGSLSGLHECQTWVFPETWWHVLKATSVLLAVSEVLQWNSRAVEAILSVLGWGTVPNDQRCQPPPALHTPRDFNACAGL